MWLLERLNEIIHVKFLQYYLAYYKSSIPDTSCFWLYAHDFCGCPTEFLFSVEGHFDAQHTFRAEVTPLSLIYVD